MIQRGLYVLSWFFLMPLVLLGQGVRPEMPRGNQVQGMLLMQSASAEFSNAFLRTATTASQIQEEAWLALLKREEPNYRLGADYHAGIFGKYLIDESEHHGISVSIEDRFHAHGSINGEALELLAFGNAHRAGESVMLGSNEWYQIRFQSFGLAYVYEAANGFSASVGLSAIRSSAVSEVQIRQASLYTSAIGDTVIFQLAGSGMLTDSAAGGIAHPAGIGAAMNVQLSHAFVLANRNWEVRGAAFNVGRVDWQSALNVIEFDTTVAFRGVEINELEQAQADFTGYIASVESDLNDAQSRRRFSAWVPGSAVVSLDSPAEKGLGVGAGAVLRWNSGHRPYGYLRGGYHLNERMAFYGELGFGGYASWQFAVQSSMEFEAISLGIALRQLEGIIMPKQRLGVGALIHCSIQLP